MTKDGHPLPSFWPAGMGRMDQAAPRAGSIKRRIESV